ncbi:hypothetical protein [Dictyobacter formicarum]|uniref:GIY-YIG domain-containing protein n=1 Tax=Dictyobacter formicarum TaxID=2778368 RepID=A0ABQ3V904_9CHLR|nr:hypothetical protein [Dictyobacter formicarum]GHO82260.1 hypothetical protein KSZ_02660 [Dictyobacter formicarum]
MNYMSLTWANLEWGPWISFTDNEAWKTLPTTAGIYRVRATTRDELFYIGETARNLRERIGSLRTNSQKETMPFNDPHTAAPALWAWNNSDQLDYECSATVLHNIEHIQDSTKTLRGLKCYLLWRYRLERGESVRCNHGHFPARYTKSKNKSDGYQGERLPDDAPDNPAGGPSYPPLKLIGNPFDEKEWMSGLDWSAFLPLHAQITKTLQPTPGVYRILTLENHDVFEIGKTTNVQRIPTHSQKNWGHLQPLFSYAPLEYKTPLFQLLEIENDLLGGFYALTKHLPTMVSAF